MASENLFGQFYSTKNYKLNSDKYQNFELNCTGADDGSNNSVIFADGEVQLVDPQGNVIAGLDLSDAVANPVVEHNKGSIIVPAGGTTLLEGLERGGQFKKMYFIVPEVLEQVYRDVWRSYINVDFTIIFESGQDSREYTITTAFNEALQDDILPRVNMLLERLGLKEHVVCDIEEVTGAQGETVHYFTFTSLVEGWDFVVGDFKIQTVEFNYTFSDDGKRVPYDLDPERDKVVIGDLDVTDSDLIEGIDKPISEEETDGYTGSGSAAADSAANAVTFRDGTRLYGEGMDTQKGLYDDSSEPVAAVSPDIYHYVSKEAVAIARIMLSKDAPEWNFSKVEDGGDAPTVVFSIKPRTYDILHCRHLEIGAFKYPNGASRVWFLAPEYPTEIDGQSSSILVNHVSDRVYSFAPVATRQVLPDDMEGELSESADFDVCRDFLYEKRWLDVCASYRSERERRMVSFFHEYVSGYEYSYVDNQNGAISPVAYDLNRCGCGPDCCDLRLCSYNPHMGLYGYLDHVTMMDKWTKVGQFYGVMSEAEQDDPFVRNLLNTMVIHNPNDFPIKVNFFTAM